MTWSELKQAVEEIGIKEEDEVSAIECRLHHGNKRLHTLKLGKYVKLVEDYSDEAKTEASGCTC
jgi:hypothetical protein